MDTPRDNGHYFDSGWGYYFIVRGNQVSMYGVDADPKRGTISTERRLVMSANADTGTVSWPFGSDRNDAQALAQRFVDTVKQGNFTNSYNGSQDFYSYVSFTPAQRQEMRGYMNSIMDITTNPSHPAPTEAFMTAANAAQGINANLETRVQGPNQLVVNTQTMMQFGTMQFPMNRAQLLITATPRQATISQMAGSTYVGSSSVGTITDQAFLEEAMITMHGILKDNVMTDAEAVVVQNLNERARNVSQR